MLHDVSRSARGTPGLAFGEPGGQVPRRKRAKGRSLDAGYKGGTINIASAAPTPSMRQRPSAPIRTRPCASRPSASG